MRSGIVYFSDRVVHDLGNAGESHLIAQTRLSAGSYSAALVELRPPTELANCLRWVSSIQPDGWHVECFRK
jgi:hypothetical protein